MAVRRALPGALLAAAALLAAGCGTGGKAPGPGDQTNGAKLFTEKCGGCHVLAAAGTKGTIGPSLDDAFAGAKKQGFKQSTIQNVVLLQIREASKPMPDNLVTGEDAVDVSGYVAAVAGTNAKPPVQQGTNGKSIFSANCASCHTLKAAGATGTVGPNLDQLKPSFPIAQHQVEVGGGVMPAFKGTLSQAQIDAVAKFVADSAGK
jgi:cbb3-type cytochrome c oxidase subunit III